MNGEVRMYHDSVLTLVETGVVTGQKITRGGEWMLGKLPVPGYLFWFAHMDHMELMGVNVWGCVLTPKEIAKFSTNCETCMQGNIIQWPEFRTGVRGNVSVIEHPGCY